MEIKEAKKAFRNNVEVFEKAWKEFFKYKPAPKTDEEDIEQQREFAKFLEEKYGLNFEFKE